MGRIVANISDYWLEFHDSVYDYVKNGKPKEFFESFTINATFCKLVDGKETEKEILKYPLLKFGNISLIKKNYDFVWDYNLYKFLYEELLKRDIKVEGYVYADSIKPDGIFKFYLNTDIGDDSIILSKVKTKPFEIKQFDDLLWISRNGLNFSKKG